MFKKYIIDNYQCFNDSGLQECLNAGFISKDDYNDIYKLKHPENKETPAENGGGTGTPTN
ncbi:hypothetical protein DY037_07185 [Apilactobacillus micheneri]|uniref:hypothetical protein n=1 Tax=Apilactobacillus micheneri TaxID=1899430 RepID=UPI00112A6D09|nr:hypothetical protein [Apilactobacillus micheneri]TPR48168.1 hypothetical protein DY037_07185 [Apilactobacillus micheneri]